MTPDWAASPASVPYTSFSNPQTLDLYGYALGNPTTNADPDGHWCFLGKLGTTCPAKQPAKSADPAHPYNELSFQAAEWAANLEDTRATIAEVGALGVAEVRAHPKFAFGALQALTLGSAFLDEGASDLALPEEEALEADVGAEASAAGSGQGVGAEGVPKDSSRVEARAVGEPGPYHNFPRSFDADIIRSGEAREEAGGYTEYTLRGTVNGKSGTYEIGTKDGEIVHRFFRPDQP